MTLLEEISLGWNSGIVAGFGVAVVAIPAVLPTIGTALRPVAKAIIKGYFAVTDMLNTRTSAITEESKKPPTRTSSPKRSKLASDKRERSRGRSKGQEKTKKG